MVVVPLARITSLPFTNEGRRKRRQPVQRQAGGSSRQEMKGVVWGDRKIWWRVAEWQEEGGEEGDEGEERRAINDALEHVTLRNASAAICRHIYYPGDTSIRPLIIILITAARKLLRMCGRSHESVINKHSLTFDIGTSMSSRVRRITCIQITSVLCVDLISQSLKTINKFLYLLENKLSSRTVKIITIEKQKI